MTEKHRRRRANTEPTASGDPMNRAEPTRRQRRTDRKRSDVLAAAATSGSGAAEVDRSTRMRAFRFPALLVVVGLIAAAFVLQQRLTAPVEDPGGRTDLSRLMPTAAPSGSLSSTWFCAGGTAAGETAPAAGTTAPADVQVVPGSASVQAQPGTTTPPGTVAGAPAEQRPRIVAEHTVIMVNASDRAQSVRVTVYPSDGEPVLRVMDLGPRERLDLVLADIVQAPFASAAIESDGGLLAVEHRVQGPTGQSVSPCATSPSSTWYFPSGTTRLGAREFFIAFNPFPEGAVLDLSFQVEEEGGRQSSRESDKLKGIVVPANRVVAIEVTDVITVRNQMSTVVRTRLGEGRVVVDRLIVTDGTNNLPPSLSNALGAPAAAAAWLFADGPAFEPGVETTYVLYNPGTETVEADLLVQPDALATGSEVEPFAVTVRAGQYATVPITRDSRVPSNAGYWVVVQSRGAPIVAERVARSEAPAARVGLSRTLGSPLVASRWLVPVAGLRGQNLGAVAVANAGTTPVTLTARVAGTGTSEVLTAFDRVELASGRRTLIDLTTLGTDGADPSAYLEIEASAPIVVEQILGFADPDAISDTIAIPVRDSLALPPVDLADRLGAVTDLTTPGSILPPDAIPRGTFPGTSSPPGSDVPGTDVSTTTTVAGDAPVPAPDASTTTTLAPVGPVGPGD